MSFQFGTGDIGVAIVGDVSDLQRKFGQGEAAVASFGNKTRGQFRGMTDEVGRLESGVSRLGAGFKGAFLGASLAVGLIKLKNVTIDAVSALSEAQVQVDRLRNGFSFGAGGLANGAKEFAFVRAEVNRLGLELGGTASQYMKMVAASRGNKMAGEQTRELFRSIAEASVVMGMGVDQSERSFMAVTQMMSKGKVMAEELRGQLGEHLPGAFSIAARAMNMTEVELNKLMETGGLMSEDFLPRFAAQLRNELAGSIDQSTLSMQANLNRLATAWINLKQQTAQGGVGNAISNEVKGIAAEVGVLGETMEASRLRGDGMWASIANTAGAAVARAAIGGTELVFEGFNGTVNALTGGIMGLNTNIDLMPDGLKPVAVAMELTTRKIVDAENEYQALADRLALAPDNIYIKSELNQLGLYIGRLREAQVEQRRLIGMSAGDASPIGSVGSGDAALARAQREDYDRRKVLLDKFNFDHRSASEKFRDEVAKQKAALGDLYSAEIEAKIRENLIKPTRAAGRAAKAAKDDFAELMGQLTAKEAGVAPDFYKDLNTLHDGYQSGRLTIDAYRDAVALLVDQQKFAKDAASELEKTQKELGAAMAAASALAEKDEQRHADSADAIAASNAELRNEIAFIGLNDERRAMLVRTKEIELIVDKEAFLVSQQNAGASASTIDALQREIELRKERVRLLGAQDEGKKMAAAMEKQADEAQRFWESVDSTAHDVFISVANEGEDAFKRIGKTLKAAVLDMLYQMTIKKWIFQISGSLSGGAGGGGLSSWADVGQQAYSYFGGGSAAAAGSSGASAYGGSYAAGSVSNSSMISVPGAASGGGGVAAGGTAGSTMTAGGYTGFGYMGYAALIAAAVMVAEKLYDSGYTRAALGQGQKEVYTYGTGNTTSTGQNEGYSTAGHYLSGGERMNQTVLDAIGVNNKWSDILSGVTAVAMVFGRRLKEYGFQADIANGAASVSGYEKYKGGLFRSNKTIQTEVNPADVEAINSLIQGWTEGSKNMARALGYSEEAIDSYTGRLRINFKGAKTAEQVAERYAEAQEKLTREMLSAASGTKITKEAFKEMMTGIQASMQDSGITGEGIADILLAGMTGRLSGEDVGNQLSELLVGGIYNGIANSGAQQIAGLFMNQIMTPIFAAIAAGVPISQAVSAAAMRRTVETARQYMEVIRATFNDPEFQAFMQEFKGEIQAFGNDVGSVATPAMRSFSSAASDAAQAAQQAAQELYGLETRMLTLLGDTAKLRERELNALSEGNRSLQERIWALEDAKDGVDSMLEAVRSATEAETERLGAQLETMRDVESTLNDIFTTLRENIRDLRGEVENTNTMQATEALALIRNAAATGVVPDGDALSEAIDSARSALEATQFATRFDRDRAYLTLANDLASLQSVVEPQLGSAEQQLVLLQENIDALDLQLKAAEDAVNALYKIDTSVLSVADAMHSLAASMGVYAAAVAQGAAVSVASSAPVAASASGGGGGGYSGGGSSSSGGGSSSNGWTAEGYWNKNPDLQQQFNEFDLANAPQFNEDPALSARDEYLAWHWANLGQTENRKFAKGGAFRNGVVTRPSFFDLGQMGEGGNAEGILPLANIGGKLGVHAQGGASDPELKRLLSKLIERVGAVETQATKTAEYNRDLRKLAERADSIGIKQRGENVV